MTLVLEDSTVVTLDSEDLQLGMSEISKDIAVSGVNGWRARGYPEEDIQMEAGNIVRNLRREDYRKLAARLTRKYGITERALVVSLMSEMARRAADARKTSGVASKR